MEPTDNKDTVQAEDRTESNAAVTPRRRLRKLWIV